MCNLSSVQTKRTADCMTFEAEKKTNELATVYSLGLLQVSPPHFALWAIYFCRHGDCLEGNSSGHLEEIVTTLASCSDLMTYANNPINVPILS